VGTGQFPAGPAFPGTGRPRGQPLGWRDRQPIGQNHGKWWPAGWSLSSGGPSARPGDAGKKINGRKRHIITDTSGHLVGVQVHAADVQDRDGAPDLLASIRYLFPWLRHVFADGAYTGEKLETALAGRGQWTLEIVKRSDQVTGFQVLPRRWWSSEPSPGLAATGDWRKISRRPSPAARHGFILLPFSCWHVVLPTRLQVIDVLM